MYTLTLFLANKSNACHGGDYENNLFELFCDKHDIYHNFFAPRTPQ